MIMSFANDNEPIPQHHKSEHFDKITMYVRKRPVAYDMVTVMREKCQNSHDNMAITPNHFSLHTLYLLRLRNTFNLNNRSSPRQRRSSDTCARRWVRRQEVDVHLVHRSEVFHVREINY